MRRIIAGTLALTVLSSTWLLGSEGATKAKKPVKKAPPPVSAQMQQMQDQLNQQQQQINQLQQQLQQSNSQLQSTQSQLQSSVQQANQQAAAAQQAASAAQQTANSLNSSVVDLKTSTTTINQSLTVVQKDVKELLNPLAIRYKGVTITPGGFADFGTAWRSRNDTSSLSSNFGGLPLNGTPNASFSEYRTDARNSRVQFKFEGSPNDNVKLTGFIMGDFYGTADPSTNANQVNSWLFRIREAWAMAQLKSGFFVAGGQMYALWTPGRKGVLPDGMMLPLAYEGNEILGMPYARGAEFRIGKKLNKNFSWAFEVEQPELSNVTSNMTPSSLLGTQNSGTDFPVGNNLPVPCCSQTFLVYALNTPGSTTTTGNTVLNTGASTVAAPVAALGGSYESINGGLAANAYPDLATKLAWDSTKSTAHFEVRGLVRFFRSGEALSGVGLPLNTAANTGQTSIVSMSAPTLASGSGCTVQANCYSKVDMNTAIAWGIGISAVAPVTKKVDFILNANAGAGTNARYNPGGTNSADATIGVNSSGQYVIKPVKGLTTIAGFEMHPTPKWDWYVYAGNEYYQRQVWADPYGQLNAGLNGTGPAVCGTGHQECMGYGLPNNATNAPTNLSPNRDLWEGTAGYIYRFWRGSFGTFQTMGEYQYIHRAVWQDKATPASLFKGQQNVADLALRYILP